MKIKKCRVCKSINLEFLFSLGKQSFTGIFPPKKTTRVPLGELSLVKCKKCDLLQLSNNFNERVMYGLNYGYMSSLNKSMKFHLYSKAKNLISNYNLKKGDQILDIGSNDGTFLNFFSRKFKLFGCDPTATKFISLYRKDINITQQFFKKKFFLKNNFKLITTISMFYDLPDPVETANQIYEVLDENGVWHIELSYMPLMIKNTSYDTICHEHLEYYSLKSIKYLLELCNFKIIAISFNQINGGSIALDVAKKKSDYKEEKYLTNWILNREDINNYNSSSKIKLFYKDCLNHKLLLLKLLKNIRSSKKSILGYGASTKGNVILQFCNIDSNLLPFIAEVNRYKFNRYTPGTKIKIISEQRAKKLNPDYLLVMPWHFRDHIIQREKEYLKNGGKLIFPLPEIEII